MKKSTIIKIVIVIAIVVVGLIDYNHVINEHEQELAEEKEKQQLEDEKAQQVAEIANQQSEEYWAGWTDTENYDYYAYSMSTREDSERNGKKEYIYSAYIKNDIDKYQTSYVITPVTSENDEYIKFWRNSVDFTPARDQTIIVKFPKDDHSSFEDIKVVYDPIGDDPF